MDIHHTGYSKDREILRFESEVFVFSISGKTSHPESDVDSERGDSRVKVNILPDGADLFIKGKKCEEASLVECSPLFFEQRRYDLFIQLKKENDTDRVEFYHINDNIREKVKQRGRAGSSEISLFGNINFDSDIGYSLLEIRVNGKPYCSVEIEVFPSKISYQDDYRAMLTDVTKDVYNLAFDLIKKTYSNLDLTKSEKPSPVEFLAILAHVFEKIQNAMRIIESYPNHKLEKHTEIVPRYKVRKTDPSTIKWVSKHPDKAFADNGGRVQITRKHVSEDTFENRLVKHILTRIYRRLNHIKESYFSNMGSERVSSLENMMNEWSRYLRNETEFTFLKNVSDLDNTQSMSLVFAMAPGYKDLYKAYLTLQMGLSLFGDLYRLSLKDVAVLYEYWCFIKLNAIVRDMGYEAKSDKGLALELDRLFVTLKKGENSKVKYENEAGEKIVLAYNPSYMYHRNKEQDYIDKVPTIAQKPDNVLSLEKTGLFGKLEYVFDAKYRINMAEEGSIYQKVYGTPGPQEDTINTMHRYRDAIVYRENGKAQYRQNMFGAYVLFPYDDAEEYMNHRFYKSIEEVNIGALPFLPSETQMVESFLKKLINQSEGEIVEVLPARTPKGYNVDGMIIEEEKPK